MISTASKEKTELCKNCAHVKGCMYRGAVSGPVYECEEFEIELDHLFKEAINQSQVVAQPVRIFQDLCSTCDHLSYCKLKDEKSIVLSCEQYS